MNDRKISKEEEEEEEEEEEDSSLSLETLIPWGDLYFDVDLEGEGEEEEEAVAFRFNNEDDNSLTRAMASTAVKDEERSACRENKRMNILWNI